MKKNKVLYYNRVVEIDLQRRQVTIRRPMSENSQRMTSNGDDTHNFYFDAVYDWKYVKRILLDIYLLLNLVRNKKMFMNKLLDHLLIPYLKVLMVQYLHMVKQEQEKLLLWKVKRYFKLNLIIE